MRKQIFINYITNQPGNSSNFSDLEYMPMKHKRLNNSSGFTLVELMVTVFLTAIAVIAIYRGYTSFSQSADAQQQIIEMQQNLRIGMYTLIKDIIRAGMKEEDDILVAFTNADDNTVEFQMDLTSGTGGVGGYATDTADNDRDSAIDEEDEARIGDGDTDDDGEKIIYSRSGENLQRQVWGCDPATGACAYKPAQTIITNVSALNFVYLDEDENVLGTPVAAGDLENIDTVEITLVVRTTNEDYRITNNESYYNINPDGPEEILGPQGDNFRRRSMSMRVKVRNAQL